LLRHWTNDRRFGEEDGHWKPALQSWTKWFTQAFPKEPALPDLVAAKPPESKCKFEELLPFLEKDPAGWQGDPAWCSRRRRASSAESTARTAMASGPT
jgi:hypothetical protein